jgi:hypothetical protein
VTLEAGTPVLFTSVSEESDDAIRVLLIEDGVIDRGFVTDKLSKQGFAVRTVASLPAAACDADVIVLPCSRANNSSIELLGMLHRLGFNVPVVLLTGEAAPVGHAHQRRGQNYRAYGSTAVRRIHEVRQTASAS